MEDCEQTGGDETHDDGYCVHRETPGLVGRCSNSKPLPARSMVCRVLSMGVGLVSEEKTLTRPKCCGGSRRARPKCTRHRLDTADRIAPVRAELRARRRTGRR